MKKLFLTLLVAFVATLASYAQTIAVVSASGQTKLYQTLNDALTKGVTEDGCTIYLPGGSHQVNSEIKIDKQVTIMGVSHKATTDNSEGATSIIGDLNFIQGADDSAVMGVYVSGNINIASEESPVHAFLLKHCNVNAVVVGNSECTRIEVNQCYLRNHSTFGGAAVKITNNVIHSIGAVNGGTIDHNNILHEESYYPPFDWRRFYYAFYDVNNSEISNNYILSPGESFSTFSTSTNNKIFNNCVGWYTCGENSYVVPNFSTWEDVFENAKPGVSIFSNFKTKNGYGVGEASDGSDIGIYGGRDAVNFNDDALAPIPRIVSKVIPDQTDSQGQLKVKLIIKAK